MSQFIALAFLVLCVVGTAYWTRANIGALKSALDVRGDEPWGFLLWLIGSLAAVGVILTQLLKLYQ
jgi:hypothetical protein